MGERWVVRSLATVAVVLLGTAAWLAASLPATTTADHWFLAWSGLDVATAGCALLTAVLFGRHDAQAALPAAAGSALPTLDAWFDVTTAATTAQRWVAGLEAVGLELPLAALGLVLARACLPATDRASLPVRPVVLAG